MIVVYGAAVASSDLRSARGLGRPGWSPGRLALITVLQRAGNLTDRRLRHGHRQPYARGHDHPLRPGRPGQFGSWAFAQRAKDSGLLPSMGSVGDCFDNAMMESFWSRMQVELLDRQRWNTPDRTRQRDLRV
jgi:hypothetical protein